MARWACNLRDKMPKHRGINSCTASRRWYRGADVICCHRSLVSSRGTEARVIENGSALGRLGQNKGNRELTRVGRVAARLSEI
jgi:hypothetical protein